MKLSQDTRKKIESFLINIPASAQRAQLINILNYTLERDETIAERFLRDHASEGHAMRAALLLVDVGAASLVRYSKNKKNYYYIEFEDGSKFNSVFCDYTK